MLILLAMMVWVLGTVFANMWLSSLGASTLTAIPASMAMSVGGMVMLVIAYIVVMSFPGLMILILEKVGVKIPWPKQPDSLLLNGVIVVGVIISLSYYAWDKLWLLEVGGVILALGVAVQVYRTIRG